MARTARFRSATAEGDDHCATSPRRRAPVTHASARARRRRSYCRNAARCLPSARRRLLQHRRILDRLAGARPRLGVIGWAASPSSATEPICQRRPGSRSAMSVRKTASVGVAATADRTRCGKSATCASAAAWAPSARHHRCRRPARWPPRTSTTDRHRCRSRRTAGRGPELTGPVRREVSQRPHAAPAVVAGVARRRIVDKQRAQADYAGRRRR